MKIDTISLITDKIDDVDIVKMLINKLENLDEKEVKFVLKEVKKYKNCCNDLQILDIFISNDVSKTRTVDEQITLMHICKDEEKEKDADILISLATDKDLLMHRTLEQQIKIMKTVGKYHKENKNTDFSPYLIATSESVLENTTIDEQLTLIKEQIKVSVNAKKTLKDLDARTRIIGQTKELFWCSSVLENRTLQEILTLSKTLEECNYSRGAFAIATNHIVLKYRNLDGQIKLMKAYVECKNKEQAGETATDLNISKNRTVDEQIAIMKSYEDEFYEFRTFKIARSYVQLKKLTNDQLLELLETFRECEYNEHVFKFVYETKVSQYRKPSDIIKLMKALYEYLNKIQLSTWAFAIVSMERMLKYRTTSGQIKLLQTFDDCTGEYERYQENIFNMIVDYHMLTQKTLDEQLAVIQAYKTSKNIEQSKKDKVDEIDSKTLVYSILTNSILLETRTTEEHLQLIEALEECEYNKLAFKIAIDRNVLENRTTEEQIRLMRSFKECEYNALAYKIAIDPELLKLDIEEHLKIMKTFKECKYDELAFSKTVSENMSLEIELQEEKIPFTASLENITNIDDMKRYIEQLKKDKVDEIGSKTLVYKYKI